MAEIPAPPPGFALNPRTPSPPPGFVLDRKTPVGTQVLERGAPEPGTDYSGVDRFRAGLEAGLGLGTEVLAGIPNLTLGGLAALGDASIRRAAGVNNLTERSPELVEGAAIVPTYTPSTELGRQTEQDIAQFLNIPFAAWENVARGIQDRQIRNANLLAEVTGEPYEQPSALAPALVQTLPDILGSMLGLRGVPTNLSNRRQRMGEIQRAADEIGLDLDADYLDQLEQMGTQGERFAGTGKEGIEQIPDLIRERRQSESSRISDIFEEGRQAGATLPASETLRLGDRARDALGPMTYTDLPTVNRVLSDMDKLGLPDNWSQAMGNQASATAINDLMELRKSINADLPSDTLGREYRALNQVKGELDNFLQDAFERDMINGSPAAIQRWREGFKEWSEFKTLFDDNRTIRKIWQEDLNPEQVKRLVFNKNAVNPGADSADMVASLKSILGEDAPQIDTLRMTVLEDLVSDVTRRNQNLKAFDEKWAKFKKDNPSLVDELFSDELVGEMDDFADFANAVEKTNASTRKIREMTLPRLASVLALGHGIARAGARVALGERMATAMLGNNQATSVMREMLGYNPRESMIPLSAVENVAAIEVLRESPEE